MSTNRTSSFLYRMAEVDGEILTNAEMMRNVAAKYRKMEIALHHYKDNIETNAAGDYLKQSRAAEALSYDPLND